MTEEQGKKRLRTALADDVLRRFSTLKTEVR